MRSDGTSFWADRPDISLIEVLFYSNLVGLTFIAMTEKFAFALGIGLAILALFLSRVLTDGRLKAFLDHIGFRSAQPASARSKSNQDKA